MTVFFIGVIIVAICVLLFMWRAAHVNKVYHHTLHFKEFPESFHELRLFFISDIHRRLVATSIIEETGKADIVIIGGDLIEKGVPFSQVNENLKRLKKIGPLFFVWGNNDYEVDHHRLDAMLLENGVKILDNTCVSFESDKGEAINLLGVDSVTDKRDRIDLALLDRQTSGFSILVSHDPAISKKVKSEHEISLILSGHTHGGQIRLGSLGVYEKGGIKHLKETTLFVSNGYGTTMLPMRLGAPAGTHVFTIKRKMV